MVESRKPLQAEKDRERELTRREAHRKAGKDAVNVIVHAPIKT